MNYWGVLAALLVGIFLFTIKLGWLGIIFIILALITAFYNPIKRGTKNTWEELDKAEGSFPEGKLMEYTKTTAKQAVNLIHVEKEKEIDANVHKHTHAASKNFFTELKSLFK